MTAARPLTTPPTVERPLLQLLPAVPARPLPKRLDPRRRSWRMWVREEGVVFGVITAACVAPAYAIAQILLGGAQ